MTETQTLVQQWLQNLGAGSGSSFNLDAEGNTSLQGEEGVVLILQVPDPGDRFYLSAQLGEIPEENREKIFYRALLLNLFQQQTGGAALSVDPSSNQIVLSYSRPAAQLDFTAFSNLIQNLLATAATLRAQLLPSSSAQNAEENIPAELPAGALKA